MRPLLPIRTLGTIACGLFSVLCQSTANAEWFAQACPHWGGGANSFYADPTSAAIASGAIQCGPGIGMSCQPRVFGTNGLDFTIFECTNPQMCNESSTGTLADTSAFTFGLNRYCAYSVSAGFGNPRKDGPPQCGGGNGGNAGPGVGSGSGSSGNGGSDTGGSGSGNYTGKSTEPRCIEGNPINGRTGSKYQVETDFSGGGLEFVRTYSSALIMESTILGAKWRLCREPLEARFSGLEIT